MSKQIGISVRNRSSRVILASATLAAVALAGGIPAYGGVLFDNITPLEAGTPPANATLELSRYTYVGGVYNLASSSTSGAAPTSITGFDLVGVNGSSDAFEDVEVAVYIWGTVNTGTVNSSHPAFSNLLSASALVLSATQLGDTSIASGDYIDLEYNGLQPAIVFSNPVALNGSTEVGVTVNIEGSENGTTFSNVTGLSDLYAVNDPASAGSVGKNGYYGNSVSTDTNGNFTSTIKTYNSSGTSTAPLLRLFGTFAPVNYQWNQAAGGAWETPASWSPNSPAGGPTDSDNAAFNLSSTAGYTVTVNTSTDTCNNFSVENDNVTLALSAANTALLTVIGTLAVGQPPSTTSTGTTVGSLNLTCVGTNPTATGTGPFVEVSTNAITVGTTGGIGHLTVGNGVELVTNFNTSVGAQSTLVLQPGSVLLTQGLQIAGSTNNWTGKVDITSGYLDLPGNDLADTTNQVAEGYNLIGGGNWNGPGGIVSATAAADTAHLTAVGVIQNNQSGSPIYGNPNSSTLLAFGDYYPNPGDILVRYTYYGDANLDGVVDGSDYSLIDAGYSSDGTLTGWYYGDFNYDGVVDGSDYALIDNAFNNQGGENVSNFQAAAELVATAEVAPLSAVPEPASASVVLTGSLLATIARRRRTSPASA